MVPIGATTRTSRCSTRNVEAMSNSLDLFGILIVDVHYVVGRIRNFNE